MEGQDVTWSGTHWSRPAETPSGASMGFSYCLSPSCGWYVPVPDQKGSGMSQVNQPKIS